MFATFLEEVSSGLAKKWDANILSPAFVFWGGGLLAWLYSNEWNWSLLVDFFTKLNNIQGLIVILGALLLVLVSSGLMEWFEPSFFRLIEGYLPKKLNFFGSIFTSRINDKLEKKEARYQELAEKHSLKKISASEKKEFSDLETELYPFPLSEDQRLPTLFGNLIRAAEEHPYIRYGLEPVIVWPRLWLLLTEDTRKEIGSARQALKERILLFIWCIAFSAWVIWVPWALLVSFFSSIIVYYKGLLPAASVYSDLIRSAFDLHRFDLYEALHLPKPKSPDEEVNKGQALSEYLLRGNYPDSDLLFN